MASAKDSTNLTFGPWQTTDRPSDLGRIMDQTYWPVATAHEPRPSRVPHKADQDRIVRAHARLIAAAPDMQTALRAIADMTVTPTTDHAQLSALCIAIARSALARVEEAQP